MLFNSGGDKFNECAAILTNPEDQSFLPVSLYAKLDCFIRSIQMEIGVMQAIGNTLSCVGRNEGKIMNLLWDFGLIFQGFIIWGFAVMLSLAFASHSFNDSAADYDDWPSLAVDRHHHGSICFIMACLETLK